MLAESTGRKRLRDGMDLKRLGDSITDLVQQRKAGLCASCLTHLTATEHGADNVDIRVAMIHLALGPGFTSGESCDVCGAPERRHNPVLRSADGF